MAKGAGGSGQHWQPPKVHNPSPPSMKRPHFGAPSSPGATPGDTPFIGASSPPHMGSPSKLGLPGKPSGGAIPHFARRK
jgi:hypothetical protein